MPTVLHPQPDLLVVSPEPPASAVLPESTATEPESAVEPESATTPLSVPPSAPDLVAFPDPKRDAPQAKPVSFAPLPGLRPPPRPGGATPSLPACRPQAHRQPDAAAFASPERLDSRLAQPAHDLGPCRKSESLKQRNNYAICVAARAALVRAILVL